MFIQESARKYHHDAAQVEQYAREAHEIASKVFTDPLDRRAVLPTLVNLLASSQVWYEQGQLAPAMAIPRNNR